MAMVQTSTEGILSRPDTAGDSLGRPNTAGSTNFTRSARFEYKNYEKFDNLFDSKFSSKKYSSDNERFNSATYQDDQIKKDDLTSKSKKSNFLGKIKQLKEQKIYADIPEEYRKEEISSIRS